MITITITGPRAAAIETACHASFYGVLKFFGYTNDTAPGLFAAQDAAKDYLKENGVEWNSLWIISARPIDTTGTKTPYKAEVTFNYD